MKTFDDLIAEVQKPGLCHRCGGCVTFCTAVNYAALELDAEGKPRYADRDKCIECGLCHAICPEIDEMDAELHSRLGWELPAGRVLEPAIARAADAQIRARATDGGVVTALLIHLMRSRRIDGAVVTRQTGPFQREPYLALTETDILNAAGFFFDTSHGMKRYSDYYMTFSQIREFGPLIRQGLQRVAFVGTPCQIQAVRRMQALNIIPADSIQFCLGLFCSGNFAFGPKEREKIAEIGGFDWGDVDRINIKEDLVITLRGGETRMIMLDELEFMKRFACYFCPDYAAEFADLSFGGIGADHGWTTVLIRTPPGRSAFLQARGEVLEIPPAAEQAGLAQKAFKKVKTWSARKRKVAEANRRSLGNRFPGVKST